MIRTPKTTSVNRPVTFCSANAFTMIVVLEIAISAPAYTLSSVVQPNAWPMTYPRKTMAPDWLTAISPAVGPTWNSRRRLNSRPSPNINRVTPSSASACTIASSATSGMGRCGPTIIPASR